MLQVGGIRALKTPLSFSRAYGSKSVTAIIARDQSENTTIHRAHEECQVSRMLPISLLLSNLHFQWKI